MQHANWKEPRSRSWRWMLLAGAIALAGASAVGRSVIAQPGRQNGRATNIVLVHGAWADGSSWGGVVQRLQKAGYHVTAVQLALASLDDDVAKTREVLALQDGPTLLVAHSYGGAVITQLGANAPNVVGLVYESAFAPDQGESMKTLISQPPAPPGIAAIRPDKQSYIWLDPAGFVRFFAPDVDPAQARVLAAVQKPIAAGAFMGDEKFGVPAWRSFPTWFVISEQDQMIPPVAQHLFARRMGATVTSIAGSHVLMVSHPDEITAVIVRAAQSVMSKPSHAAK